MKTGFIIVLLSLLLNANGVEATAAKTEVQTLRTEVSRLQSRLKKLEAFLAAKGVLPPPKAEKPEVWTELEIRLDQNGIPQLEGKPVTIEAIRHRIAAVFHSGKFPDVKVIAPAKLSYVRIQTVLDTLAESGVLNVSISADEL